MACPHARTIALLAPTGPCFLHSIPRIRFAAGRLDGLSYTGQLLRGVVEIASPVPPRSGKVQRTIYPSPSSRIDGNSITRPG